MVITTQPYRLDSPDLAKLYVRRAGLAPIESLMALSLLLIGLGIAGHGFAIGSIPIVIAIYLFGSRFIFHDGFAERLVRLAQGGGRRAVLRQTTFGDDGLRIQDLEAPVVPKNLKPVPGIDDPKAVTMAWDRLDRVETQDGYLFFLPFPHSPRGLVIPEASLTQGDLEKLHAFLADRSLIKSSASTPATE